MSSGPTRYPLVQKRRKPNYDQPVSIEYIKQIMLDLQAQLDREDYITAGQPYLPLDSGYYDA